MSKDFSHIIVDDILLLGCEVAYHSTAENPSYALGLTELRRMVTPEHKELFVSATFDLMHGIEKPPCTLICTYLAIYTTKEPTKACWDEFSDGLAVAHMIPYVREFISSVTNRMPLPPLMMKPVNAFVLVDNYNAGKNKIEALEE